VARAATFPEVSANDRKLMELHSSAFRRGSGAKWLSARRFRWPHEERHKGLVDEELVLPYRLLFEQPSRR
jgi:hypothetical protein